MPSDPLLHEKKRRKRNDKHEKNQKDWLIPRGKNPKKGKPGF